MNPAGMMKFMGAINEFKNNHPKFATFLGLVVKGGMPEGSIIEITVTRPGEDPITANMKVLQSDLDLLESLKDMRP